MYLVTIINDNIETVINAVSIDNEAPRITGTVKQGINSIDSFSFTISPNNPGYNLIWPYRTLIKVLNIKTRKYEFIGRVLVPTKAMNSNGLINKSFVCESELGYLLDTMQSYEEVHNISVRGYLEKLIQVHNANTDDNKKFVVGNVDVVDNNDSLYRYTSYDSTKKNIDDDLINKLGGELQIRYEGNIRYLDYLTEIETTKNTELRLGKNIKDITNNIDPTSYITRLIPLGAKLKTTDNEGNETDSEERLTISSVNNGVNYIDDVDGIKEFGIIEGYIVWEDTTQANNLLRKGQQYLNSQKIIISNKITALDLSLIGIDIDSFEVGNYYPIKHKLLDIDYTIRIIEKSISIENPKTSSISLGDTQKDIKQYQLDIVNETRNLKRANDEVKGAVRKVERFTSEEIYRVDNRLNAVIVDVNNEFGEINSNLDGANTNLIEISNSINRLNNKVNINTDSIETIDTNLDSIKTDVSKIKVDISKIKTDVVDIKTDIETIKIDINAIKTKVDKIDSLETKLDTILEILQTPTK